MGTQSYYFARMKMNFPDITVPPCWEQFRHKLPYEFELESELMEETIPIEPDSFLRYGKTFVMPWELKKQTKSLAAKTPGWLFISERSNWVELLQEQKSMDLLKHSYQGRLFTTKDYRRCIYFSDGYQKDTIGNLHAVVEAAMPSIGGSIVHASCIKHKGKAVLFCGPSGMGKSTQARLWMDTYDCYMLSSDAPAVFPNQSGSGAIAYGMPWDGSDNIMIQEDAPVAAVIELSQSKENRIRKMTSQEAFERMMKQGHTPMWDQEAMFLAIMVMKKIARAVPFYHLDCRPDADAARLVHKTVFGD